MKKSKYLHFDICILNFEFPFYHSHFSFFILHSSFILRFAFCILHFAFLTSFLLAQQPISSLPPSGTLTNHSPDTLFCIPKQKLETLMEQEEINAQLISALKNQVMLCDSALVLKSREAKNWYGKLLETDELLENMDIRNEKQIHRRKVLTKIWFGAGVVVGWVVFAVL